MNNTSSLAPLDVIDWRSWREKMKILTIKVLLMDFARYKPCCIALRSVEAGMNGHDATGRSEPKQVRARSPASTHLPFATPSGLSDSEADWL